MLGGADNPNGELLSYIIGADTVCIITGRAAYLTGAMSLAWKGNPLTPGLLFIPIQALYKGLECGISVKDCTLSHLPFHGYLVS